MKWKLPLLTLSILTLSGCASVDLPKTHAQTNQQLQSLTSEGLQLLQTPEQVAQQLSFAEQRLQHPIDQSTAVSLLLNYSPQFQALLAKNWSQQTRAAQIGRIHNPVFSLERVSNAHEIEIGRVLSFGLLDLLTLPARQQAAHWQLKQTQTQLVSQVVRQITQVRKAWIDAVVAQEKLHYAQKVMTAAEATSTLAKRMQATGNFTRMQSLRQQLFYSDATVNVANRQHDFVSKKEQLVRLLGLSANQAKQLRLPNSLNDLPTTPIATDAVKNQGEQRLDIQLAKLQYDQLLDRYNLDTVQSFTDIEAGIVYESSKERATGESESADGFEIEIALPIFDWGELRRQGIEADILNAQNQLFAIQRKASSHLRESYSAYRTAWDIAQHYQTEVVPMQEIMAEENTYRYNGMFIGVFELIADSKNQIAAFENAIQAKADFWKAQANLDANLIGHPINSALTPMTANSAAKTDAH